MPSSGAETKLFPSKLHALLTELDRGDLTDIVSWMPHGRSFRVHNHERFAKEVLPRWFQMGEFNSFIRQLNLYGPDRGAYFHPFFLRGNPSLCQGIERIKVKGKGHRKPSAPEQEPDFYTFPPLEDHSQQPLAPQTQDHTIRSPQAARRSLSGASQLAQGRFTINHSPGFRQASPVRPPEQPGQRNLDLCRFLAQRPAARAQPNIPSSPGFEGGASSALIAHLRQAQAARTRRGASSLPSIQDQQLMQSSFPGHRRPELRFETNAMMQHAPSNMPYARASPKPSPTSDRQAIQKLPPGWRSDIRDEFSRVMPKPPPSQGGR